MNRAVYCINCEYSESRGISQEQTELDGIKAEAYMHNAVRSETRFQFGM